MYEEDKKVPDWKAISRKRARQTSTSNRLAERTDSFTSRIDIRLRFDAVYKLVAESDLNFEEE